MAEEPGGQRRRQQEIDQRVVELGEEAKQRMPAGGGRQGVGAMDREASPGLVGTQPGAGGLQGRQDLFGAARVRRRERLVAAGALGRAAVWFLIDRSAPAQT